jgi:hypothetical protein
LLLVLLLLAGFVVLPVEEGHPLREGAGGEGVVAFGWGGGAGRGRGCPSLVPGLWEEKKKKEEEE